MHAIKISIEEQNMQGVTVVNLFFCPLNTRTLRQHRFSPNLESDTIQPVHETLPKTGWSEDTTPSKVKVIL